MNALFFANGNSAVVTLGSIDLADFLDLSA